jgi:hypothetical protein
MGGGLKGMNEGDSFPYTPPGTQQANAGIPRTVEHQGFSTTAKALNAPEGTRVERTPGHSEVEEMQILDVPDPGVQLIAAA